VAGWQAAGEEGTSALPALDIGCAPGGWTKVLSAQPWVSTVVAVDPAGVVPAVAALPGVTVHSVCFVLDWCMACRARRQLLIVLALRRRKWSWWLTRFGLLGRMALSVAMPT
jgi:hypothetical protein